MLVKELKKLLSAMPDNYRVAFATHVSDNVPTLIEIDQEDFYLNDQFGYLEIDTYLSEEAYDDLAEALEIAESKNDEGILIYTSNEKFKSTEEKMLARGMSLVSN